MFMIYDNNCLIRRKLNHLLFWLMDLSGFFFFFFFFEINGYDPIVQICMFLNI